MTTTITPHRFHGGLTLDSHKNHPSLQRIVTLPPPSHVVLTLAVRNDFLTPIVTSGDHVHRGDVIATHENGQLLHASISGDVTAIGDAPSTHPSQLPQPAITITADQSTNNTLLPILAADADRATLQEHIRLAGIVGLGGAGFPTFHKTNTRHTIHTLVINGMECEPFIACDMALMQNNADAIVEGIGLLMRATAAERAVITIENDKPDAIAAIKDALQYIGNDAIECLYIEPIYPAGAERQLVEIISGKRLTTRLPIDSGFLVLNIGTVYAVYQAINQRLPLTDRVVTICGDAIAQPYNVRAPIGTPLRALAAFTSAEVYQCVIIGGGMMGVQVSDQAAITKQSNCVQFLRTPLDKPPEQPCIRCNRCVDVCPELLLPQQLYWRAKGQQYAKLDSLRLHDCIECGLCDYVCPSDIPLVHYFRFAKGQLRQQDYNNQQAALAKSRYEFRLERIERDKKEREATLRKRREQLAAEVQNDPAKQQAIKDALARTAGKR